MMLELQGELLWFTVTGPDMLTCHIQLGFLHTGWVSLNMQGTGGGGGAELHKCQRFVGKGYFAVLV